MVQRCGSDLGSGFRCSDSKEPWQGSWKWAHRQSAGMDSCPLEKDSETLIHHCAAYTFMLIKGGAVCINAFDTIIEIKLPQISFCAAEKGGGGLWEHSNASVHLILLSVGMRVLHSRPARRFQRFVADAVAWLEVLWAANRVRSSSGYWEPDRKTSEKDYATRRGIAAPGGESLIMWDVLLPAHTSPTCLETIKNLRHQRNI